MRHRYHAAETEAAMSILEFFGFKPLLDAESSAADTETVRNIVQQLDHMEPARARYVAAFAYILSRVARADLQVSHEETRAMERIVIEHGELSEEQAVLVVQMAKSQNLLFGGTENFLVTREMSGVATRAQKLALLDCLFAVSAADDSISTAEDNVIRQIATELLLEHADFIRVRSRYREHLAVLKKDEPRTSEDTSG